MTLSARRPAALLPAQVLMIYSDMEQGVENSPDWSSMTEYQLWRELCLCILSGNTLYETALSALGYLERHHILRQLMVEHDRRVEAKLSVVLGSPLFAPEKADGALRKFRFPNARSRQLTGAARELYMSQERRALSTLLESFAAEDEAREYLSQHIPGLGMKEASHFLRNVGYARDLAVVDVHIRRFLEDLFGEGLSRFPKNSRAEYKDLEELMRFVAEVNGLSLPLLDLAIWSYMRAD